MEVLVPEHPGVPEGCIVLSSENVCGQDGSTHFSGQFLFLFFGCLTTCKTTLFQWHFNVDVFGTLRLVETARGRPPGVHPLWGHATSGTFRSSMGPFFWD